MTLDPSVFTALAARLDQARADRLQTRSFLHDHPMMDAAGAYEIQHAWAEARQAGGARLAGYKVGLSTPAMLRTLGLGEPAYGHLFADTFFSDGFDIAFAQFFEPRVEMELAFVLGRDLAGPDCTLFDVLNAVDYVTPAVEIVDLRFRLQDPETGAQRSILDAVADNTSSAGVVLGGRASRPGGLDLARAPAILYRNGAVEASGVSGAVMNNPALALAWLARALDRRGLSLKAGQVVMSGSMITPFPAAAGDTFTADYGPLGAISLRFT